MSTSDFDDVIKLPTLRLQFFLASHEHRYQTTFDAFGRSEMNGGGDDVIAGLSSIYVIIRVHWGFAAYFPPQNFNGPVGNNLITIHIGGCSRSSLKNIHRKLIIKLPLYYLVCCLDDGVSHLLGEKAQLEVDPRRSPFDHTQSADEFPRKSQTADWEVLHCPLGLGPIVG